MRLNRLFSIILLTSLIGVMLSCSTGYITRSKSFDLARERKQAAHKKRRIIMNNDGNDCRGHREGEAHTPQAMLARRTTPLVGSQVDAIFYCTGVFDLYTNNSKETELHILAPNNERFWANDLIAQGRDPLEIMIDFGHKHNLEVFWSMRMNDTHDSNPKWSMLLSQWKKNNPHLMMAPKRPKKAFPYGGKRWSAVNYGKQEVREKVFRILRDVVTRYDVDGIELDFFRHPVYFKSAMTGQPVTQQHCDMMTALLARVREMVDVVAKERRKPILIAVRVPDSVPFAKGIGLDLVRWMEDDLIDILTGSGYIHLEPWANWAALGHKYDVPVYACLSGSRLGNPSNPEARSDNKEWRDEALRAWDQGVDGIYTFNLFKPADPLFRELGDPELLRTLPRKYKFNRGSKGHQRVWLKGGEKFFKKERRPK
jgi:Glycosyl hydrolase-like 10